MKLLMALALLGALAGQSETEKKVRDRQTALMAGLKKASSPGEVAALVNDLLLLAEEAVAADLYELAGKIAAQAEQSAKAAKDSGLAGRAQAHAENAREIQREFTKARSFLKTLEERPDDPEANLIAGKFMSLYKGDWAKGVPMLAKGSDAQIRAAALKEGTVPPVTLGNEWWAVADARKGAERDRFRGHALACYQEAWPTLEEADRTALRDRCLTALAKVAEGQRLDVAGPWAVTKGLSFLTDRYAHSGKFSVMNLPAKEGAKDVAVVYGPKIRVASGQRLKISVWSLSTGTGKSDLLGVKWRSAAGDDLNLEWAGPVPGDTPFWVKTEGVLTVPANAAWAHVMFRMGSLAGKVWVDDLSLRDENGGPELVEQGGFEK